VTKAVANNAIAVTWEKVVKYKGIIILFGSSSGAAPWKTGKNEIKVPKKNMMGVVTRIQNLGIPMRLMLAYRIVIVPPQNDRNIMAVRIAGRVIINISSNPGAIAGNEAADSSVVTGG
jgi:hypothetical protein